MPPDRQAADQARGGATAGLIGGISFLATGSGSPEGRPRRPERLLGDEATEQIERFFSSAIRVISALSRQGKLHGFGKWTPGHERL
jgi:hypothetical protein